MFPVAVALYCLNRMSRLDMNTNCSRLDVHNIAKASVLVKGQRIKLICFCRIERCNIHINVRYRKIKEIGTLCVV